MPNIEFQGKIITCEKGENLRKVLLRNKLSPYHSNAKYVNCRALGTCGTCALKIEGPISPITKVERWRLNFPPHHIENGLRLACQVKVLGDLKLEKGAGFWGEKV